MTEMDPCPQKCPRFAALNKEKGGEGVDDFKEI